MAQMSNSAAHDTIASSRMLEMITLAYRNHEQLHYYNTTQQKIVFALPGHFDL